MFTSHLAYMVTPGGHILSEILTTGVCRKRAGVCALPGGHASRAHFPVLLCQACGRPGARVAVVARTFPIVCVTSSYSVRRPVVGPAIIEILVGTRSARADARTDVSRPARGSI